MCRCTRIYTYMYIYILIFTRIDIYHKYLHMYTRHCHTQTSMNMAKNYLRTFIPVNIHKDSV